MANFCDNRFYFSCKKNFAKNIEYLEKELEDYNVELFNDDYSEGATDGVFVSKWSFPTREFEEIFSKFKKEDGVYFRCLSEDFEGGYVAMNIFEDNEWRSEQTFDL